MQSAVDPEVRQQIEAVLRKHEEAYNEYDAAAFAAGFTQYAVELSQGGMARGREEIEERYAADLASHPTKQSFKLLQVCAVGDAICAISEFFHSEMAFFEFSRWRARVALSPPPMARAKRSNYQP